MLLTFEPAPVSLGGSLTMMNVFLHRKVMGRLFCAKYYNVITVHSLICRRAILPTSWNSSFLLFKFNILRDKFLKNFEYTSRDRMITWSSAFLIWATSLLYIPLISVISLVWDSSMVVFSCLKFEISTSRLRTASMYNARLEWKSHL